MDLTLKKINSSQKERKKKPRKKKEKETVLKMAKNTFSEVLVSRMKDSSAHGLPNIARAKTVIGRAIWTILFLAGLALLTWQVCERCARYWSNEYGVNLDIRFDKEISFPAVTFCNMNPVRASQFLHLSADFQQLFAANSPPSQETRNEFIANGDVTSVLTGTSNSGGSTTEVRAWLIFEIVIFRLLSASRICTMESKTVT